jgi:hypothetical protein
MRRGHGSTKTPSKGTLVALTLASRERLAALTLASRERLAALTLASRERLILVALLAVALLAACGDSAEGQTPKCTDGGSSAGGTTNVSDECFTPVGDAGILLPATGSGGSGGDDGSGSGGDDGTGGSN